ncbi:kinase [Streptomyces sp. NPDC048603]|uniref:GHMP family kinase ATP-binding protein n=1 Tax=Streptomyces sp. NPDC048603 TaxID=3365577 RepID=UPI00371822FE
MPSVTRPVPGAELPTSAAELPAPAAEPTAPVPGTVPAGRTGTGRAFGTFGELLQGALPEPDGDFLVTFPLARWSTATFRPAPPGTGPGVRVLPAHKTKARRVAEAVLAAAGAADGGVLEISADLPEGKGLASSSADLVATVRAVGDALGIALPPDRAEDFLRAVEPSDGVMHDGIVAFHHRTVRLRHRLGELPPLAVIAHDLGGQVDTVAHNRTAGPVPAADRAEYARLLDRLTRAVARTDLPEVGAVATRSAELHAARRPRPGLDRLRRLGRDTGGYGLVLAHSGTVLGILLDADDPELDAKTKHVRDGCAALGGTVSVHRSLGTGEGRTPTGPPHRRPAHPTEN